MEPFFLSLLYLFGIPILFAAGLVLLIKGYRTYKDNGRLTGKALAITFAGFMVSIVLPIFMVVLLLPV